MRIGNAPVSWGIFEVEGLSADLSYQRVMDEIAVAGYQGTELGPWGFYPTDAAVLRTELDRRGLILASAFCPVDLTDPAEHTRAEELALGVAELLQSLGTHELILADPQRPARSRCAGRAAPTDEMSSSAWLAMADGLNRIGRALAKRGMSAVFHHHAATYVETAREVDHVLEATDPELVGLCLDTGHAVYGGADPVAMLKRWSSRVRYVHLKDVDARALNRARAEHMDFETGVRAGVFCPLGDGCVDFAGVFALLREYSYDGWLIVEQDVIVDDSNQVSATSPSPLDMARKSRTFLRKMSGE